MRIGGGIVGGQRKEHCGMASGNPLEKLALASTAESDPPSSARSLNGGAVPAPSEAAQTLPVPDEAPEDRGPPHADAPAVPRTTGTPGRPPGTAGLGRFEELLEGQGEILDFIAAGASLDLALEHIALFVERIARPARCSIHLLDDEAKVLHHSAAPSLPRDYVRMIDGLEINPDTSPCHAAAFHRARIAVADLEAEERWPKYCELSLAKGLRAICTKPILDRRGQVLGILALHYKEPHRPDAGDHRLMDAMASLTAFGIESVGRERALESANERFVSLAASIPGVVYQRLVTPDGDIRYTYISEGTKDLFGVSAEEVLADPQALFDCHGPEYRATFRERLLEASRKLEMWDVEAQIITRDGEEKWTHAIARPHRLPNGSVLWDGVILDATRIKKAEFAAALTARRTRKVIVESISQGFVLFDPDDRLVICNSIYSELYPGLENVAVPGASYQAIARAEIERSKDGTVGGSTETALFERMVNHELPESSAERRISGDRWILIHERRTFDGSTAIVHSDVTDLKRREKELRLAKAQLECTNTELGQTNSQLDIALSNMTQGLCLLTAEQKIALSNRRYAEIFGLSQDLARPGITVHDQMHHSFGQGIVDSPETKLLVEERLRQAASRARCTFYLSFADGRVIEVIHQPLDDGGAVETFADVTEEWRTRQALRESEERMREKVGELLETRQHLMRKGEELKEVAANLAAARDEAQAANRAKSEFLANMSHELRTPLNAVIGFSEVMIREVFGSLGSQRYMDYAEDIHSSGSHLLGLINDILDLSKVEAGQLKLRDQAVTICDILTACQKLVQDRAEQAGVLLSISCPVDLPKLRADELKLKQIFLNLLSNAVKFTPSEGTVSVTAQRAKDGGIVVSVADTGIGIDPNDMPLILEPFQQIASPLSRKYEGTGLGLPLVKGLTELHGGSLHLESTEGEGTTATVRLPADRVIAAPGQQPCRK